MLVIKQGVRVTGIRPEIMLAVITANDACREAGVDCVITSVIEGKHDIGSLHYAGAAIDIRTRNMSAEQQHTVVNLLSLSLGDDYDVVHESDHIHIEWQPKQPLTGRVS